LLFDSYNPLWSLQELKTETLGLVGTSKSGPDYQRLSFESTESSTDQRAQFSGSQAQQQQQAPMQHHECLNCGKKYKWLDSLRRHQRVECGNKAKKFACNMCDRKYKYRYEMKNHIVSQHRISELGGPSSGNENSYG
jgi:hypothetical protein